MELYIGGFAQGKMEYCRELYPHAKVYDENTFFELVTDASEDVVIWNHFHLCVKQLLQDGKDTDAIAKLISIVEKQHPKLLVISDEVGNGIVPMQTDERLYRETTGRLLIEIAKQAQKVVRITCKIAQQIK